MYYIILFVDLNKLNIYIVPCKLSMQFLFLLHLVGKGLDEPTFKAIFSTYGAEHSTLVLEDDDVESHHKTEVHL